MTVAVNVSGLSKIFSLPEKGRGAVTISQVLRSKKAEGAVRHVKALDDVSFTIKDGERVGIIGANGAGKTTLLSILAGMSPPTSGKVDVDGKIHAMLTIGAVLKPELTGRENVRIDHEIHGRSQSEIDAVVDEIIEFTELGEFIDRPVRTYSSGMMARLAFTMGAFVNPEILILDETLSVGDVFFSRKASSLMKKMADRGRIVILVSHSTQDIVNMCTRCLWLEDGHIKMDGKPGEVTKAYENAVQKSDEKTLRRKFGEELPMVRHRERGYIDTIELHQANKVRQANVAAMKPLALSVAGELKSPSPNWDLVFRIQRVDGRLIWHQSLKNSAKTGIGKGPFEVNVTLGPFILGQHLFRLDVELVDDMGTCDLASRVFEVIDEKGQYGGTPLMFHPPIITCKKRNEVPK